MIESLKYYNLKDVGNTTMLKSEVETAWPQDTCDLRAELLGKSPHLSMEILKATAYKTDVFTESVFFEIIAANPDGKGQLLARNLLTYAYGHQYNNCLPVDDTAALKSTAVLPGSIEMNNGLAITVMPNPASSWAAFAYKLPAPLQEAVLQISDAQGRHVTSFTLKAWQGQQLWDIREVKKGIYFYILKAGNQSKSGKLVIK